MVSFKFFILGKMIFKMINPNAVGILNLKWFNVNNNDFRRNDILIMNLILI